MNIVFTLKNTHVYVLLQDGNPLSFHLAICGDYGLIHTPYILFEYIVG